MKSICLVLLWISAGLFCAEQDLPRGHIIERVSCLRDASQTYALYLPSGYMPDKKWPILCALDPGARGAVPVQRFREAAEQYGYILAGSNNARNGPVKIVENAVNALVEDTSARFSLDPRRVYLAGFSGGARGAILAAVAANGKIAGVAAFGAGSPAEIRQARPIPFPVYLAAGIEDFNHPELRELSRTLEKLGVPHEFETFPGGHDWPPETVCTHALEWFELQAMKNGIREKDTALIDTLYHKNVAEAESLERNGQPRQAFDRYGAAFRGFSGIRDATAIDAKRKELSRNREVRKAISRDQEIQARQGNMEEELSGLFASSDAGVEYPTAMQKIRASFEALTRDAEAKTDEPARIAARRVLSRYWVLLNEEVSATLQQREYGRAARRLEAMAWVRPESSPQVYYHLARAYSLGGRNDKALDALKRAVSKGYRDFEAIESSRDLEPLKQSPEYRKLMDDLRKR